MTKNEYDSIASIISKNNKLLSLVDEKLTTLIVKVNELTSKTVVVTSIDKEMEKLKLEIECLKDERSE